MNLVYTPAGTTPMTEQPRQFETAVADGSIWIPERWISGRPSEAQGQQGARVLSRPLCV